MSVFLVNKRLNGNYKFVFTNRKGHTVFTSIACKRKEDCESIIDALRAHIDKDEFVFTRKKTPAGKLYFRISKGGLVLATSRKFSTELSMEKGITHLLKYVPAAETLEMPKEEDIFGDTNKEEKESEEKNI